MIFISRKPSLRYMSWFYEFAMKGFCVYVCMLQMKLRGFINSQCYLYTEKNSKKLTLNIANITDKVKNF